MLQHRDEQHVRRDCGSGQRRVQHHDVRLWQQQQRLVYEGPVRVEHRCSLNNKLLLLVLEPESEPVLVQLVERRVAGGQRGCGAARAQRGGSGSRRCRGRCCLRGRVVSWAR